jgi:chromosome segregation ATPase
VDLDEVAHELYGISPDEFIERRTERVGQARRAGDRTLAKQIGQLRRPTRTAWMVNLLARNNTTEIEQLLDLGRALQEAQQRSAGDDLRQLSKQRRAAVDTLTKLATDLASSTGYVPTETTTQEVSQTLSAALGDAEVAESVRQGRLTQAASYGGFGPVGTDSSTDLLAAMAASVSSTRNQTDQDQVAPAASAERAAKADRGQLETQRQLDEATRSWEEAVRAASDAAEAADRATTLAEDLADKIEELRAQLRQAESEERDARAEARAARKQAQQLRQAATVAESRRTALRDKLADQTT